MLCSECKWREAAPLRRKCHRCRSRAYALKFPIRKVFYDLRHSAKRRDIPFELDLPWFEKWIVTTEYMEKRGRSSDDLTIDRINEELGYTKTNIQVLRKGDNSSKFHQHYKIKSARMYDWKDEECPF